MNKHEYDYQRLAQLRANTGRSRAEVAEAMGVKYEMTVWRIENGGPVSFDMLRRYAAHFGARIDTFLIEYSPESDVKKISSAA